MKQRVRTILQLMVALALVLSLMPFPAVAQESMSEKADLVDTAVAAGDFTTLVELVQSAGLVDTLKGEGPFTVFAPTDEAFAAVPEDVLGALAADPELLQRVLLYHVVPGRLVAALISDGKEVATAEGSNVLFSFVDGVKAINGANIVARDIQASNGVIHVIDSVILPADIAAGLPAAAEGAAAEEAAEEAAAEATPVATEEAAEEAAAEATPVATEEVAEEAAAEATPVATEEAAEEAAAEATPVATEEAAEEAAAEATPVATEEAAEEAAAEATPVATEEAAEETAAEAVATEAPAEEAAAEEAPAPDMLPVTGGESNNVVALAAALVLAVIAAFALVTRRRMA
jgi:LPXTG-motif cell wall-anchored protein